LNCNDRHARNDEISVPENIGKPFKAIGMLMEVPEMVKMAKCSKCGTEVAKPEKTWTLAPKGKKAVTVGLYKCPSCGAYFRASSK